MENVLLILLLLLWIVVFVVDDGDDKDGIMDATKKNECYYYFVWLFIN